MRNEQAYEAWAPEGALWSPWVAPVLFTQLNCGSRPAREFDELLPPCSTGIDGTSAVVLDIDGVEAVRIALALARKGMVPVPLFNASPAPLVELGIGELPQRSTYEVIPMDQLLQAMCWGTEGLMKMHTDNHRKTSAPVFMLDSRRLAGLASEGMFDNRWMLVPQDFPSAKFLKEHGVKRVLLVQADRSAPQSDLAHVLLRYQEQGIAIVAAKVNESDVVPMKIKRPAFYKGAFYRVLARLGLRRNAIGGFGSWVPESGGGG
jgi:hypothetical protein